MEENIEKIEITVEEFMKLYTELCQKYNYEVRAYPIGVILDDGKFEYRSLEYRIVKKNKQ